MWLLCSGRLQVLDVSWCSKADQTSVLFWVMCVCVCSFFWGVIWTPKLSKVFAKNSCLTKIRNDTSLLSIFEQLWPLSLVSRDSWSTSIKWIPHASNDTWTISHHKAWNLARISFNLMICHMFLVLSHQHVVVSPHILAPHILAS